MAGAAVVTHHLDERLLASGRGRTCRPLPVLAVGRMGRR